MYAALKFAHVGAAIASITGFTLRGFWMLTTSPMLERKIVRVLPHIVDTLFLLTGIALIRVLHLPVLTQPWLLAKLVALVFYVLFGMVALRRGRTPGIRAVAFVLALATFAYIVGVALSKSTASWLAVAIG